MRQDLIKLIEAQEDVTNVIVLTHNIDFVFIQLIVLPALRRCGRPTLTVFADAQCATETFTYQSPVLTGLGTRYRVVPVAMESGFRFHPKALLLSSPAKSLLSLEVVTSPLAAGERMLRYGSVSTLTRIRPLHSPPSEHI